MLDLADSRYLQCVARIHANRNGLSAEDTDDYEIEFEEWYWISGRYRQPDSSTKVVRAWLHACAENRAKNYAQRSARHRRHEELRDDIDEAELSRIYKNSASPSWNVDECLREQSLRDDLLTAILRLSPSVRNLLLRRAEGSSYDVLALETGRTAHAVRQSVHAGRKYLALLLKRSGWTNEDFQDAGIDPPPLSLALTPMPTLTFLTIFRLPPKTTPDKPRA